jgi:hypothetical protein
MKSISFGKQNIHVQGWTKRDFGGLLEQLRLVNENEILWDSALCLHLNRHEMKYRGNLRLGPLLSAGVSFVPESSRFNDIDQFRFHVASRDYQGDVYYFKDFRHRGLAVGCRCSCC